MRPVEAQPAASVALVRETDDGLQVFMMRRSTTMAFAPGMYVFPGGRVDPVDLRADDPFVACAIRELREEADVVIDADALLRIDHWVTPEDSPLRYDVHFYAAALPENQEAVAVGTEMDLVEWMLPADALAESEAGRMPMLIPTVRVLALLDRCGSMANLREHIVDAQIRPQLPRRLVDAAGVEHWTLVDAITDDVLEVRAEMPRHWEKGGAR